MKVAFIEPYAHLEDYRTDYHMILPGQTEDYYEFFCNEQGHKILDNGAAEGNPLEFDDLIDLALKLEVSELVLPDKMGDPNGTVIASQQFLNYLLHNKLIPGVNFPDLIGVIHGATVAEVDYMCRFWARYSDQVKIIGLPRILDKTLSPFARYAIARDMMPRWVGPGKDFKAIHCLGATENPKEVILLATTGVRGIDTSYPASMSLAMFDVCYDPYMSRHAEFFTGVYQDGHIANHNHHKYLEWADNRYHGHHRETGS